MCSFMSVQRNSSKSIFAFTQISLQLTLTPYEQTFPSTEKATKEQREFQLTTTIHWTSLITLPDKLITIMNKQEMRIESKPKGRSVVMAHQDTYPLVLSTNTLPAASTTRQDAEKPAPDQQLRRLPSNYIYEGRSLACNLPLQDVMDRITTFLRLNSIEYTQNQFGRIDCQMDCFLKFSICLWRHKEGQVVVELQRSQGCAIGHQRVRQTLFRVLSAEQPPQHSMMVQVCGEMPSRVRSLIDKLCHEECHASSGLHEDMVLCEKLLSSPQVDQNQLGMETLVFLTKPSLSDSHLNFNMSLMFSDEPRSEFLREQILKYLEHPTCSTTSPNSSTDKEHAHVMTSLALQALSNSLGVLTSESSSELAFSSPYWKRVSACLRKNLCNACQQPHEAAMSAKCLRLAHEPLSSTEDDSGSLLMDLSKAYTFAKENHFGLEQEILLLKESLSNYCLCHDEA